MATPCLGSGNRIKSGWALGCRLSEAGVCTDVLRGREFQQLPSAWDLQKLLPGISELQSQTSTVGLRQLKVNAGGAGAER